MEKQGGFMWSGGSGAEPQRQPWKRGFWSSFLNFPSIFSQFFLESKAEAIPACQRDVEALGPSQLSWTGADPLHGGCGSICCWGEGSMGCVTPAVPPPSALLKPPRVLEGRNWDPLTLPLCVINTIN